MTGCGSCRESRPCLLDFNSPASASLTRYGSFSVSVRASLSGCLSCEQDSNFAWPLPQLRKLWRSAIRRDSSTVALTDKKGKERSIESKDYAECLHQGAREVRKRSRYDGSRLISPGDITVALLWASFYTAFKIFAWEEISCYSLCFRVLFHLIS